MGKKTKKIQYFYRPMPYYPMMYYQGRKTKKKSRNEFKKTYGDNFTPQLMMAKPVKRINFGKNDNAKKIVSNLLDLYNIDFNSDFLDFSMNNFQNKISEYRTILNDYNYYVDSVNGIKSSTELLELQTVMNPNELHLLLEGIDVLFKSAKSDKQKFMANVKSNMVEILQRGGGYVRKYDLIAFLNGDKRNRIKNRICDIIYLNSEEAPDHPIFINDYEFIEKINRIRNDETMDNCFNMFLQQKILTHLNIKDKDKNAYYRGEFQENISECLKKEYYDHNFFYKNLKTIGLKDSNGNYKISDRLDPKQTHIEILKKGGFKVMDDSFEFMSGYSMINVKKLNNIFQAQDTAENYDDLNDELTELIQVFHELQIPDTTEARAKEKKMKDYLGSISFAIIMGGLLPPSFFGPDYDYNPFDVLSVIMCIFEGSTVCALMSALPLFSPLMDALATFSVFRKIFRKIGIGDNLGIRSKKAISDALSAKIAKENKLAETINQVRTNIHKANKNLETAIKTGNSGKKAEILAELEKFAKQNKKLVKAKAKSDKAALLARTKETQKSYKKFLNKKDDILKKIENGQELSNSEKILLKETNEFFATKGVGLDTTALKRAEIPGEFTKIGLDNTIKNNYDQIRRAVEKGNTDIKDLWKVGSRDGFFKVKNKYASQADFKSAELLDIYRGKYFSKTDSATKTVKQVELYADTAKKYDTVMAAKDLQKQFDSGDFGVDFLRNLKDENTEVYKLLNDTFPGKFTGEAITAAQSTGKIRVTNEQAKFFSEQINMQYVKIAGENYYGPVRQLNKTKSYYESTGVFINTASDYTKAMKPHLFPKHSVSIKISDQITDVAKTTKVGDEVAAVGEDLVKATATRTVDNAAAVVTKGSDDASKYLDDMFQAEVKSVKKAKETVDAAQGAVTNIQRNLAARIENGVGGISIQVKLADDLAEAQKTLKSAKESFGMAQKKFNFHQKSQQATKNVTDLKTKLQELGKGTDEFLKTKKELVKATRDAVKQKKQLIKNLETSAGKKVATLGNNLASGQRYIAEGFEQAKTQASIAKLKSETAQLQLDAARLNPRTPDVSINKLERKIKRTSRNLSSAEENAKLYKANQAKKATKNLKINKEKLKQIETIEKGKPADIAALTQKKGVSREVRDLAQSKLDSLNPTVAKSVNTATNQATIAAQQQKLSKAAGEAQSQLTSLKAKVESQKANFTAKTQELNEAQKASREAAEAFANAQKQFDVTAATKAQQAAVDQAQSAMLAARTKKEAAEQALETARTSVSQKEKLASEIGELQVGMKEQQRILAQTEELKTAQEAFDKATEAVKEAQKKLIKEKPAILSAYKRGGENLDEMTLTTWNKFQADFPQAKDEAFNSIGDALTQKATAQSTVNTLSVNFKGKRTADQLGRQIETLKAQISATNANILSKTEDITLIKDLNITNLERSASKSASEFGKASTALDTAKAKAASANSEQLLILQKKKEAAAKAASELERKKNLASSRVKKSEELLTNAEGTLTKLQQQQKALSAATPDPTLIKGADNAVTSLKINELKTALNDDILRLEGIQSSARAVDKVDESVKTINSASKQAAASKLQTKAEYLQYEKAVEPLTTPLEKIQQSLDTVASAYLVDYNLTEQVSSSKNAELDAIFVEQNNLILDKIWSDQAKKTVSTVGKMMMPEGTGNLITLADTLAKYSNILDPGTDARKKRDEVLYGRVKQGINNRKRNRMEKDERVKSKGVATDININKLERELKRNTLEMNKKGEEFIRQGVRENSGMKETDNWGEIVNQEIKRDAEIAKAMGEKYKRYDFRNDGPIYKKRKNILKGAKDATFANDTAFDRRMSFREKLDNCMAPNQRLSTKKCEKDETQLNKGKLFCCEKEVASPMAGGGKKNNTMRNEIYNDSQLGEEIEKFRIKFKKYKKDFDEPLQEMMNKRSQYRLQQKSKLKDKYLTLFRKIKDDVNMVEDRKTTLEYEIFQNMSNKFKDEMKQIFQDLSMITRNLFTRNTVDLGTYFASKKIINKYEKIEEEINTLSEDKEIGDFRKEFDKKVKTVLLQEKKVEKVKRDIQEFKAKEDDLDKEKEILKKLLEERNNFGAKTDKEKKYSQKIVLLKEIQKEYEATQVFVNPDPKLEKMYLTAKNMKKNKSGLFTRFQDKVTTEIDFIRNEYDIAVFLSLPIPEIKKLNLVRYLQEIYLDIVRVKEALKKINLFYKKENKKINVELEDAKKQMKFYYENLAKIKRKEDKILFNKRFQKRQKNMKLLIDTQKNILEEYFLNENSIDKCNDLMVFCDFQISDIKSININSETKNLLLSDKTGLIDITQLHEFKETDKVKTDAKELLKILKNILKYKKKINKSRKAVYKTITNKSIKLSKLKKKDKKTKKNNPELKRQIDVVNRRIESYELTSFGYMNMKNPLDILVFYGLLTVGIVKKKTYYTFNDDNLKSLNIKKTKEMDEILNKINYFILEEQVI